MKLDAKPTTRVRLLLASEHQLAAWLAALAAVGVQFRVDECAQLDAITVIDFAR
jgi:hypothetical protein